MTAREAQTKTDWEISQREAHMDMKRIAIGTIVGGVALYVIGYLIFDLALSLCRPRSPVSLGCVWLSVL